MKIGIVDMEGNEEFAENSVPDIPETKATIQNVNELLHARGYDICIITKPETTSISGAMVKAMIESVERNIGK